MHIAVEVQRQPRCKLQQYNSYLDLSTATALSQSIRQVSTPMQPAIDYVQPLPQHVHNQSDKYQLRCNLIDYVQPVAKHLHNRFHQSKSEATLIHYVQALAKEFHNLFDQSQLRNNLDELPTSTGTKHSFTIKPITINSAATLIHYVQAVAQHFHNRFDQPVKCEATSIDYVQAVAKQFHNQSNQYHLNLDSLRTLMQKQFHNQFHQSLSKYSLCTPHKHWQSSFIIRSISVNQATSIHYIPQHKLWQSSFTINLISLNSSIHYTPTQALAKQFHNQSDHCHLQSKLDSLRTSTQAVAKQFHNQSISINSEATLIHYVPRHKHW